MQSNGAIRTVSTVFQADSLVVTVCGLVISSRLLFPFDGGVAQIGGTVTNNVVVSVDRIIKFLNIGFSFVGLPTGYRQVFYTAPIGPKHF